MDEKVLIEAEVHGENSVKELKATISALRDELVKTTKGSSEYSKTVDTLVEKEAKLKEVMTAGKTQISGMKGSYNALKNEMSALKKVWAEVTDEGERARLGEKIASINAELKGMDANIGNFQRNVGDYEGALTRAYASQRQELAELKKAMDNLDPNSSAYAQAFERASEITHNLTERQENLKYASKDLGDQLSNVKGIATNMVAGFSAAQAAMGLFGAESEDVQKAMLKVQQSIQLVQGLEGLDGFIKRTEGLSLALKKSKTSLTENAAATAKDATATVADTTAKGAQATATNTATVAQKGLNAALKANPVGAIIIAVTALVALVKVFKDDIINLLGGTEKLNSAFDKFLSVISGVGNAILQYLLTPLKTAISVFKTVGKVMSDVFTGNWDQISNDVKEGVGNVVETVKNGIDVVENYNKAADDTAKKREEKRSKERAEARAKELDEVIKNNEAKYGSDYKYTEKGKKEYEEMLNARIASYKKDSEEYKQAIRERDIFQREYTDRQTQREKDALEERKKREEDAKAKIEKIKSEFSSKVVDFMKSETDVAKEQANARIKAFNDYINLVYKSDKYGSALKYEVNPVINRAKFEDKIKNDVTKTIVDGFINGVTKGEDTLNAKLDSLQTDFERTKLTIGINFPEDELKYVTEKYSMFFNFYENELKKIDALSVKTMKELDPSNMKLSNITSFEGLSDEDLAIMMEKFPALQSLLNKRNTIVAEGNRVANEKLKELSSIVMEDVQNTVEGLNRDVSRTILEVTNQYELAETELTGIFGRYKYNEIEISRKAQEEEDAIYLARMDSLQKMKDKISEALQSENLANEDRIKLKQQLADVEMQMENETLQHTIATNKRKKESYKAYAEYTKQALNGIADVLGTVADIKQQQIQQDIEDGKITQEEGEKQFKSVKNLQKAQALINAFSSAVGAYQSMASIPYVGPVLGAAAAAAALASGIAQVKQIERTSLESSSSSSAGSTTTTTPAVTPVIDDYVPEYTRNLTTASDTQNLNDMLSKTTLVVSVTDINKAQNKVQVRDAEASF